MLRILGVCLFISYVFAADKAVVKLQGDNVSGSITFTQTSNGLDIEGEITGLTKGKHGFHIHQLGDLTNGCTSTGSHFNPYNKNHGAPTASDRHAGDLGNVVADENGVARVKLTDSQISLQGETCILGRAVVVHAGEDDLGLGGHADSLTTGNAGGRVACGVIGVMSEISSGPPSASVNVVIGIAAAILIFIVQ